MEWMLVVMVWLNGGYQVITEHPYRDHIQCSMARAMYVQELDRTRKYLVECIPRR